MHDFYTRMLSVPGHCRAGTQFPLSEPSAAAPGRLMNPGPEPRSGLSLEFGVFLATYSATAPASRIHGVRLSIMTGLNSINIDLYGHNATA